LGWCLKGLFSVRAVDLNAKRVLRPSSGQTERRRERQVSVFPLRNFAPAGRSLWRRLVLCVNQFLPLLQHLRLPRPHACDVTPRNDIVCMADSPGLFSSALKLLLPLQEQRSPPYFPLFSALSAFSAVNPLLPLLQKSISPPPRSSPLKGEEE
jgi:hypothetical protein